MIAWNHQKCPVDSGRGGWASMPVVHFLNSSHSKFSASLSASSAGAGNTDHHADDGYVCGDVCGDDQWPS